MDIDKIKQLAQIAVDLKLDCIQVGDVKIIKSKHDFDRKEKSSPLNKAAFSDEELYFHSSGTSISLKDIEALEAGLISINKDK